MAAGRMINPDGVARGHQRADTLGQNLNRCYAAPSRERAPVVFALRQHLLGWHSQVRHTGVHAATAAAAAIEHSIAQQCQRVPTV